MADKEPIAVIGVGWVGLVSAACFAELGHEVWARDIIPEKVESLARGEVPIHEPGLPELVARNAERLHFTTDMAEVLEHARLLFVCVDTPPTYSGDADLSRVESVLADLGESDQHALVMKSTVPVGTGRSIQRRRPGTGYVSNPEFLKEGSAVADFMSPDRVVIGADEGSEEFAERVGALYAPLDAPLVQNRRGERRDGQAGFQRLPRDEDLVHQRDRERLGGARGRRVGGGARNGPRRPHRPEVPAGGHRVRGLVPGRRRDRPGTAAREDDAARRSNSSGRDSRPMARSSPRPA